MRTFIVRPGVTTVRWPGDYTAEQAEKRRILDDIAYAVSSGFVGCRQPTPGALLPADQVERRMGQVADGWAYEARTREPHTRGFDPRIELADPQQTYLTERLLPFPQTSTPWAPSVVAPAQTDTESWE